MKQKKTQYAQTLYLHNNAKNITKNYGQAKKKLPTTVAENEVNVDPITLDEILLTLKSFKNKIALWPDEMNIEFIRKVSISYLLKFLEFFNTCWKTRSILLNGKEL
jgi:hypothetical protein